MIQDQHWTFICRQDLWQHSHLKLSPSKTALCAIFQSNDFNDYWDFSTLQRIIAIQWGQPWNLPSPCFSDRLLFHLSSHPQNQIWSLILIIWDWLISVSWGLFLPLDRLCSTRSLLIHEPSNLHKSHFSH